MTQSIELSSKEFAAIIRATFPAYRRKTVYVRAAESVELQDLNWSGGTRSSYRACTLDGRALGNADKYHAMAPWDARQVEGISLPIVPGACVVRGGTFCGKESKLTLYVHPSNMPGTLSAP